MLKQRRMYVARHMKRNGHYSLLLWEKIGSGQRRSNCYTYVNVNQNDKIDITMKCSSVLNFYIRALVFNLAGGP